MSKDNKSQLNLTMLNTQIVLIVKIFWPPSLSKTIIGEKKQLTQPRRHSLSDPRNFGRVGVQHRDQPNIYITVANRSKTAPR